MSPGDNNDQASAAMASTTTLEDVATRSQTKEVGHKQLEQATALSMAETYSKQNSYTYIYK
jgi:hypothetical protein